MNNKAFWQYACSVKRMKKLIPHLKKKNGTLTNSSEEKANVLNKRFVSVFTKEEKTVKTPITSMVVEVLKLLNQLRIDKTAGPDEVHPFILNIYLKLWSKLLH